MQVWGIALDDLAVGELPPASTPSAYDSFNWDYVYNYKGSSAVAVDHFWILTAAHVADDGGSGNLVIDGETYYQQEVIFHTKAADPDGNDTADLALVRYDKPLPGYYLLYDEVPVGSDVVICGFGYRGAVVSTPTLHYFTEDNTGGHATKRWGTNRIDYEETIDYGIPGLVTNKGFRITISTSTGGSGKTPYEAGCNTFDSGCGLFFNDAGTWKLAGHLTIRYGSNPNYVGNFAVATTYYVNWIKSVIADYDIDMDGLPDWWEELYDADATSMVATNDVDYDLFSNYEEWVADTNPTNGLSFLKIDLYTNASEVVFGCSTNRRYQVEFRTDLADTNESWQVEVPWFDVASTQHVQTVSVTSTSRFYRVRAKLP